MLFSGLELSKRLERAEGNACVQFATARRTLFPESGAEWMECAGAWAVFDRIDSPSTQTFGLGLFEDLTPAALDMIEDFFLARGASVLHEVSPFAGAAALGLLCARQYQPFEISNVLFQPVPNPPPITAGEISVRITGPEEAQLWSKISARGWAHEHPEFLPFLEQSGAIASARPGHPCFLAEVNGEPGAAGSLSIHDGVALFSGAATVPEMRRRGLQSALLEARLRHAFERGCDIAMMVTEVGSESQRNAERQGFRIAYTRIKWRLSAPAGVAQA